MVRLSSALRPQHLCSTSLIFVQALIPVKGCFHLLCVHCTTGKTKILDNVRRTSVQEGEAGGITQQIGATYVPGQAIAARTESLRNGKEFEMKMPGLLIIDTPGRAQSSLTRVSWLAV